MFIISVFIISVSMVWCSDDMTKINQHAYSKDSEQNEIPMEILYQHCETRAILALLNVNHAVRNETFNCLFCHYTLDKLDEKKYQIQNKIISHYIIRSLYPLYGTDKNWIENQMDQEKMPPAPDETLYLKIFAKKINIYNKFYNKFSDWLPLKESIIGKIINKHQNVMKKMASFIFKDISYKTEQNILYITDNSEKKLKNDNLLHHFCTFHAILHNVSEKKNYYNHMKNNFYYFDCTSCNESNNLSHFMAF